MNILLINAQLDFDMKKKAKIIFRSFFQVLFIEFPTRERKKERKKEREKQEIEDLHHSGLVIKT